MVGLPHRTDRVRDHMSLPLGPRPGGEEVPNPSAKVGTGHEHVKGQCCENGASDDLWQADHGRSAPELAALTKPGAVTSRGEATSSGSSSNAAMRRMSPMTTAVSTR